jgi:hypothetical protein
MIRRIFLQYTLRGSQKRTAQSTVTPGVTPLLLTFIV